MDNLEALGLVVLALLIIVAIWSDPVQFVGGLVLAAVLAGLGWLVRPQESGTTTNPAPLARQA